MIGDQPGELHPQTAARRLGAIDPTGRSIVLGYPNTRRLLPRPAIRTIRTYGSRYDRMVSSMTVATADLTAYARIRDTGLALFADRGVAATSVRDIAAAAGVSPGLVQHHFGTKAGLRDTVNEHVVALATNAFAELPSEGDPAEVQQQMGERVTEFVRDNPIALRYVARATADRDEPASRIFDAFVAIARGQFQRLADHELLRSDADVDWAALHVVLFILSTVLLRDAIGRHLPAPFDRPEQLDRWNQATNDLFRRGLYRRTPLRGAETE